MTRNGYIKLGLAALVLALLGSVAWWGYKSVKRSEVQRNALALVQDSTSHLREALGLIGAGVEIRSRLEASFSILEQHVKKVQSLNSSFDPALVRACDAYITDVHAFLRRQLDSHKARDAVRADISELAQHMRAAGDRSSAWIGRALELKKQLEKDFFDYRFAAGGLDKSFSALRETRKGFDPLGLPASVIDEPLLAEAHQRMQAASAKLAADVEETRKLPLPR